MMKGQQAAPLFRQYAALAADEAAAMRGFGEELQGQITAVEAQRTQDAEALAAVYLPAFTGQALASAAALTGFRGFARRDPIQAMKREAARLASTVAALDADPLYVNREALVGPQGRYQLKLAEAQEFLAPWAAECARFEALPEFLELVQLGYDTPDFAERWWQPSYWRHWAAGDRICAALGLKDFGDDVLPAWKKAAEPRDRWRREVERVQAEINAVHDLVRQRDEATYRLAHLEEIYLGETQTVLGGHLVQVDAPLLVSWMDAPPDGATPLTESERRGAVTLIRRVAGQTAKIEALREMLTRWVLPTAQQVERAAATFEAKSRKYAYGKKASRLIAVPEDYPDKVARLSQRRGKARALATRVQRFDGYDRYSFDNAPELWWVLFTDGRRPGVFTPTLADWYQRHPDVTVIDDPEWAEGRGAAAVHATHHLADAGDLS